MLGNGAGGASTAPVQVGTSITSWDRVDAGDYHTCATTTDGDTPSSSQGYFYLVTVENRLDEQGPKGIDSYGAPRQGNVCP